jgi:uncharacterized membrane protein
MQYLTTIAIFIALAIVAGLVVIPTMTEQQQASANNGHHYGQAKNGNNGHHHGSDV